MEMKKSFKLNTGIEMPSIGLGTWRLDPGEIGAAVKAAIKAGYRHIDCAPLYGNEAGIGQALSEVFKEQGLKREDIFITSKLWNNQHAKEDVLPACEKTLKDLQLDYLDLYLIHEPATLVKEVSFPKDHVGILGYDKQRMAQTWKAMEELVRKGLCKAVGVSNFTTTKVKNLLEAAEIVPAVNQVELHPFLPQTKLKKFCDDKGIILTGYSSLGSPARPALFVGDGDPVLLEEPLVKELAAKRNCSPAQVLLAWAVNYGAIAIPKSVVLNDENRIKQNYETYNVKLLPEDMTALANIGKKFRYLMMRPFFREGETAEMFWDGEQL